MRQVKACAFCGDSYSFPHHGKLYCSSLCKGKAFRKHEPQFFNGNQYDYFSQGGYYRNSKTSNFIHRDVWEFFNGLIPEGFAVHHKDHDPKNNDINNLSLLTLSEHAILHQREKRGELNRDKICLDSNCERIPRALGLCSKHYQREKKGFNPKNIEVTINGKIYKSLREAERETGFTRRYISKNFRTCTSENGH